jgi:hypothetical protein
MHGIHGNHSTWNRNQVLYLVAPNSYVGLVPPDRGPTTLASFLGSRRLTASVTDR